MSKERLEEMEELLNEYYDNIDDPYASTDNAMAIIDRVGYFLKRVQELKEANNKNYWIASDFKHENLILMQQNKRYRERIEYMLEEAKDHKRKGLRIQHWALIKDLEETLECEE